MLPNVDTSKYSVVTEELKDSTIVGIVHNDLDKEDDLYYAFRTFVHSQEEVDELEKELQRNIKRYAVKHSRLLEKRNK